MYLITGFLIIATYTIVYRTLFEQRRKHALKNLPIKDRYIAQQVLRATKCR